MAPTKGKTRGHRILELARRSPKTTRQLVELLEAEGGRTSRTPTITVVSANIANLRRRGLLEYAGEDADSRARYGITETGRAWLKLKETENAK